MVFSETLENLKSNLPSQYRDNIIDYKTLKDGIDDVVERLNKTGLYDFQTHSHLIMENGMKTNIDNHIRETFKKHNIDIDDTIIEVFDDGNVVPSTTNDIHNNENENNGAEGVNKGEQDNCSITSIYEKDLNPNFKDDLEDELKKSQVKLVKFINNAKDKDEIIRGLSLKYYQIFYALREIDQGMGQKQLKSSLIVSISKVEPHDLDVQKLLDEITDQNVELFEQDQETSPPVEENSSSIVEEKIDQEHLQKIRESLRIDSIVSSPYSVEDIASPAKSSLEDSNKLLTQSDIDILRLSQTPVGYKINEYMLGRRQDSSNTNVDSEGAGKRKVSMSSFNSSSEFSSSSDDDNNSDKGYDDEMFNYEDDDEVSIILPSTSNEDIPKDKEIEPDPIAVKGDDEEMIKKRASIIQKRLSEYNCEDGISKEKFVSLFNNCKSQALRKGSSNHSSVEGKLSISSSNPDLPDLGTSEYNNNSYSSNNIFSGVQNYWEIPVYSYYSYSVIPEEQRSPFQQLSEFIPNTEEPESIENELEGGEEDQCNEVIQIVEVIKPEEVAKIEEGGGVKFSENVKKPRPIQASRQTSIISSPVNTAKNSPDVKEYQVGVEPIKEHNGQETVPVIPFTYSQNSSTATLNFNGEPQPPAVTERRKSSFSLFIKRFSHSKSSDDVVLEKKHSLNSKLSMMNKHTSLSTGEIALGSSNSGSNNNNNNNNNNKLYVRKAKSHSFSNRIKTQLRRLSSRRSTRKSMNSIPILDPVNECKSMTLEQLNEPPSKRPSKKQSSQQIGKEKRVEILLESDTVFLNKMVAIFKNLSRFEKDCRNLFDGNIQAVKSMLKEVSVPGKVDTYPWRDILRLYRETDLWTHNGKVNTWEQAADKLELFKTKAQSIISKFQEKESKEVFRQFLKLNHDAIILKEYYEINQTAIYMVLKEHDKDTKLSACEGLPCFIKTDFFSDNACKRLTYEITNSLLSVIPDPEKYACPICQELAYKPIRLNCNHLFCLKCLIKAQKKNLDNCPVCRDKDAVKNATSKNLDKKLLNMFLTDFPREVKARKKMLKEITHQQKLEEAREMANKPGSLKNDEEEETCTIM